MLKTIIYDLIVRNFCFDKERAPSVIVKNQKSNFNTERTLSQSYKLENNPDYFEIMAILNPKRINTIILKSKQSKIQNIKV